MTNFLKNLIKLFHFKKNEKKYKRIIFNENKNTYKYLKPILKLSNCKICVLSLEEIEEIKNDKFDYYHFGNKFVVSILFLILKIKYLYTTTPDLNSTIFKRSIYNQTKYIYIQHSPISLSAGYRSNAFIHFDVIQAINVNQYSDIIDLNNLYKKKIKPFKYRYLFLEDLKSKNKKNKIDFLIAPTWNTDFYINNLHKKIFKILKDAKKSFVFRPHYMSILKNELDIEALDLNDFELDIKPNLEFDNYSNLISDWSGIYLEFAILNKKKPILINTQMKVRNKKYINFTMKPIEQELRDLITVQFETYNIEELSKYISNDTKKNYHDEEISNILISKFY